jgi:uncharacterized protein YjiS (DUF1127 family)
MRDDRRGLRAPAKGAGEEGRKTMSRNTTNTLYGRFRRWRRYRETVRELQGLSGRELSDLGISRGDIGRLAREAASL